MNNQLQAMMINQLAKGWVASDSKDNALATATKAAVTGATHVLTGISASYSGAKTGLLQVKDSTTVVFEHYIVNADVIPLDIAIAAGHAVSAELAASGAGGTLGKVNITGYTITL